MAGTTWYSLGGRWTLLEDFPSGCAQVTARVSNPSAGPPGSLKPGATALFIGRAGTGKRMAAQILGADSDVPVLEVDLAGVLAGQETAERLMARIFLEAETRNAILLLMGAESLLRTQPHVRRAEHFAAHLAGRGQAAEAARPDCEDQGSLDDTLSKLLERSRRYRGLVIFASTATRRPDATVAGRFDAVVDFPLPDAAARKEIWRRALPNDSCLSDSALEYLATWLRWPGAKICRCCAAAAGIAAGEGVPVHLQHVAKAVEQGHWTEVPPEPVPYGPSPELSPPEHVPYGHLPALNPPVQSPIHAAVRRSPATVRIPPRPRVRSMTVFATIGAVVAVVLGFIVAGAIHQTSHGGLSESVYVGPARISIPSNWRREPAPATIRLGLRDELVVAPEGSARGLLVIGLTPSGYSQLLPERFISLVGAGATPQIVNLDGVGLYRYESQQRPNERVSESVYEAPSTVGTIVAICLSDSPTTRPMTSCEQVLGTIRLSSGRFVPLQLDGAYAQALAEIITKLNTLRSRAGLELAHAGSAAAQAAAARQLAAAHSTAASELLRVSAGSATVANSALAGALRLTAEAYNALAVAVAHHDARQYHTALASLANASTALSSAFDELNHFGYGIA